MGGIIRLVVICLMTCAPLVSMPASFADPATDGPRAWAGSICNSMTDNDGLPHGRFSLYQLRPGNTPMNMGRLPTASYLATCGIYGNNPEGGCGRDLTIYIGGYPSEAARGVDVRVLPRSNFPVLAYAYRTSADGSAWLVVAYSCYVDPADIPKGVPERAPKQLAPLRNFGFQVGP